MSAATLGQIAEQGSLGYATAALSIPALSDVILMIMGLLSLGFSQISYHIR